MEPMGSRFYIGMDTSGDKTAPGEFFNAPVAHELGVEFIVYHYRPTGTVAEETGQAARLIKQFEAHGIYFINNNEVGNWSDYKTGPDGFDWVNREEDKCHCFKYPPSVLQAYARSPAFAGVLYDELEHSIINRNLSITLKGGRKDLPQFPDATGLSLEEADGHICAYAKKLVAENVSNGAPRVMGEHVWPVLFHNFARAGMPDVYKQQKENWSNVYAACAAGAAMQYGVELWACVDLWNHNNYPGHSPDEMEANLLFAYLFGVDRAYVENIGRGDCFYTMLEGGGFRINEYGKRYRRFAKEYIPAHPRPYTFRDFLPSTAIIRFDDTDWGQGYSLPWADRLFGAYNLKTSRESHEWLRAWSTITHGHTLPQSISFNCLPPYEGKPHRSFAPANGPIVFDHTVSGALLDSVKLAFLCGSIISKQTLKEVTSRVRQGKMSVVSSPRFAPEEIRRAYAGGTYPARLGAGLWVITDDMASKEVYGAVRPLLGPPDEMTYAYKDGTRLRFKISDDGNTFTRL